MPITKSAKKALRQNKTRKQRNLFWKKEMKKLEKKIKKLVEEKKIDEAKKILPQYYKMVDKATKNNVIKKNTGARKKSKVAKLLS
ncbi:MAG TPA: 30S ribosomal protein S20 [Candidatus Pacearchaeota archaeon]|nr:30S ribosomal protein S20 [Candidatus Pacearchaeota archaeon]HOK94323.1 30S ribosomal protein S20 [Candidatus Pacearchaeota archaeon]HPO75321.1 30S ribosomal protein S20 [Candidatus Pacearchaeota archaeon]